MDHPKPNSDPLSRLRNFRVRPERDLSLGFLKDQFKREVEKPHKQLLQVAQLWGELVPPALQAHARLEGLTRGVLRVAVDSSPHLYELSGLLRQGLEHSLISLSGRAKLSRVQLRLAPDLESTDGPGEPARRAAAGPEAGEEP